MKKVIACQLPKWSDYRLGRQKFCEGPRKQEGRKRSDTFRAPTYFSAALFPCFLPPPFLRQHTVLQDFIAIKFPVGRHSAFVVKPQGCFTLHQN